MHTRTLCLWDTFPEKESWPASQWCDGGNKGIGKAVSHEPPNLSLFSCELVNSDSVSHRTDHQIGSEPHEMNQRSRDSRESIQGTMQLSTMAPRAAQWLRRIADSGVPVETVINALSIWVSPAPYQSTVCMARGVPESLFAPCLSPWESLAVSAETDSGGKHVLVHLGLVLATFNLNLML
jgi:hypothetical protein